MYKDKKEKKACAKRSHEWEHLKRSEFETNWSHMFALT